MRWWNDILDWGTDQNCCSCSLILGLHKISKKPTSNLKILCISMVTWTEYAQLLGTTVQNAVVMVIWHTGFVHCCLIPYILVSDIYKCVIHSNDNDNFLYILDKVSLFHVRKMFCVNVPHFKILLVLLHPSRYYLQLRTILKLALWLLISTIHDIPYLAIYALPHSSIYIQ